MLASETYDSIVSPISGKRSTSVLTCLLILRALQAIAFLFLEIICLAPSEVTEVRPT